MRLRLASLNTWGLPWPVGHRVDARLRAIGAGFGALAADAIALQEVWTGSGRAILVEAGRRAGLAHTWHREPLHGGSGLLVLSRLPFGTPHFERYELRGLPERIWHGDYHGGKGFVVLELATDAGPLCLVNTHLHARYAPVASDTYAGHRMGQVLELAERLREIELPLVVLGDFNFTDDRPEYRVLTRLTGVVDAAAALGSALPTRRAAHPLAPQEEGDARIDYAFVRDGRERRIALREVTRIYDTWHPGGDPVAYSDHDGLHVELELQPGGSPSLPAPDAETLAIAGRVLERGREAAMERRGARRAGAAGGVCAAGLALVAARRDGLSRRRFLRASLAGAGVLALGGGVSLAALAATAGAEELRAFDAALARLQRLGVPRSRARASASRAQARSSAREAAPAPARSMP